MASLSPANPRPEAGDQDAFAEMYDDHAGHLFDYCCGLLGNRTRAASATQITLIAGHSLAGRLQDRRRMRAWLLALGRWECLNGNRAWSGAGESPQPSGTPGDLGEALAFLDAADDDVAEEDDPTELTLADAEAVADRWVRAALDALPRADREILDLVYRHAVSLADLPAVLGITASSAPGMLEAARAKLEKATEAADLAAAAEDAAAGAGHWADAVNPPLAKTTSPAYRLAAVPLAGLPPSVWRRTARVVMDPKFRAYREAVSAHAEHLGPDGFPAQVQVTHPPSGRKLLLASALMAGLLLAPAGLGAAGYAAFSGPAPAFSPGSRSGIVPVVSPSGNPAGSSLARSSGHSKRSAQPGSKPPGKSSAGGLTPQPGTSAPGSRKHSTSPSPTSSFSAPSPKPSHSSSPPPSSPPPSSPPPSSPPPSSPPPTSTPPTSS
jgi:DNA-directed RNA polymerase specialized sigma24 family protein